MSAPGYRLLQTSLLSDCVFPGSARLGRQAATAGAIVADMSWRSGSYTSPLTADVADAVVHMWVIQDEEHSRTGV